MFPRCGKRSGQFNHRDRAAAVVVRGIPHPVRTGPGALAVVVRGHEHIGVGQLRVRPRQQAYHVALRRVGLHRRRQANGDGRPGEAGRKGVEGCGCRFAEERGDGRAGRGAPLGCGINELAAGEVVDRPARIPPQFHDQRGLEGREPGEELAPALEKRRSRRLVRRHRGELGDHGGPAGVCHLLGKRAAERHLDQRRVVDPDRADGRSISTSGREHCELP